MASIYDTADGVTHPQDGTPHAYCENCDCCISCGCCECGDEDRDWLEVTIQAREESDSEDDDICEDCMATIGGKVEGCDTCNITRFYKGRWYEPYED
jgi:hypothetical protein